MSELNQYVKKLVSLNPDKYEYKETRDMISRYYTYLLNFLETMKKVNVATLKMNDLPKTFLEWLETEI